MKKPIESDTAEVEAAQPSAGRRSIPGKTAAVVGSPQSRAADDAYAVTAYLVHPNGIVGADAVMDASTLPKVAIPNRSGFRADPRPDTANAACMRDCR